MVAGDGFHSIWSTSASDFAVVTKPPQVVIEQPVPNASYLTGQPIRLRAIVLDPEDGSLPSEQIDLDHADQQDAGARAGSSELARRCRPAAHPLTLQAVDAEGHSTSAQVHVEVAADADIDHMADDWERAFGLEVGADNGRQDLDVDGLSNEDEYTLGTDPLRSDTDGDGLRDGDEVRLGSNPRDPNSVGWLKTYLPVLLKRRFSGCYGMDRGAHSVFR